MVEDSIRAGGTEIESSRNVGITAALSAPRGGIWMGQSALINLAGEKPQQGAGHATQGDRDDHTDHGFLRWRGLAASSAAR